MEKWLPTGVSEIINSFNFDCKEEVLKKNLAYNIQYLQYLSKNIEEEKTTSVLYVMRYKTFVVTSMSVIEAIFVILLNERNLIPIVEWKDGQHHRKNIDENTIEVSFKRKRVNPQKKKIKFDESIYLMETNEVLKSTDPMYSVIRVLQDLRNRLHLDKAKQLMDSDYNSFGEGTYKITKLILYNILNNEIVSKDNKYIDFLKPPEKIIITH